MTSMNNLDSDLASLVAGEHHDRLTNFIRGLDRMTALLDHDFQRRFKLVDVFRLVSHLLLWRDQHRKHDIVIKCPLVTVEFLKGVGTRQSLVFLGVDELRIPERADLHQVRVARTFSKILYLI